MYMMQMQTFTPCHRAVSENKNFNHCPINNNNLSSSITVGATELQPKCIVLVTPEYFQLHRVHTLWTRVNCSESDHTERLAINYGAIQTHSRKSILFSLSKHFIYLVVVFLVVVNTPALVFYCACHNLTLSIVKAT